MAVTIEPMGQEQHCAEKNRRIHNIQAMSTAGGYNSNGYRARNASVGFHTPADGVRKHQYCHGVSSDHHLRGQRTIFSPLTQANQTMFLKSWIVTEEGMMSETSAPRHCYQSSY